MVGSIVDLSTINRTAGDICYQVSHQLNRAAALKLFLDRFTAQNLVDSFGFTLGDANILKSAMTDLATINTTFAANRSFINQVAGLGDAQT